MRSGMRLIYVDESGTSNADHENVSVVAALVVNPDTQSAALRTDIESLYDRCVPAELRKGYVSHAVEIVAGDDRHLWPGNSRWDLLYGMLEIPSRHRLPVSMGMVRRDSFSPAAG